MTTKPKARSRIFKAVHECVFRPNPATDSDPILPPIPIQSCHPWRRPIQALNRRGLTLRYRASPDSSKNGIGMQNNRAYIARAIV